jgi:transcriptional regulator with XRE-family HTH domain
MVSPHDAQKILGDHFEQITLDEFNELREKYVGESDTTLLPIPVNAENTAMILYQREAAPLPLNAYLASALTALTSEQRDHLIAVSEIVASVCEDLEIDLYEPRKVTDPVDHSQVSSEDVFNMDRERVLSSDLVVHVADYASTGAGEELDFALAALIPIVLIAHGDTRVSRMVTGIPALKLMITYDNLAELNQVLRERLAEIRPILEERKLAFSDFDKNMVGHKVRISREEAGLTRQDVALQLGKLLTVERLRQIEESSDKVANPSLLELRRLAVVLKTTVADLAEPDLDERMIALLQELMLGRVEARFGMSSRDQRKVFRRILYRVLDKTEED